MISYNVGNINIDGTTWVRVDHTKALETVNLLTLCRWCSRNVGSADWHIFGGCTHFKLASDALAYKLRFGI